MTQYSAGEFDVYSKLINFLQEERWKIVCACPPAGTDNRYRKCILPRRDLNGSEKGPRDEVDITAYRENIILLIECKHRLSHSFTRVNALNETDYEKLKRIQTSFRPEEIAALLRRGTGVAVPSAPDIALALAVEIIDYALPIDMTVFQTTRQGVLLYSLDSPNT